MIGDSAAAAIGAMIIAPLMTPIMGIVVALVAGSASRALRSGAIVLVGIVLAVLIGFLMGSLMPSGWDAAASAQILARTSPTLLDLIVALASGGAGAYALSRTDVGDALPGVAIAISLAPPLNTVGILLAGGESGLAAGALLLFSTNFAAILLAGAVTFVLTGLAEGAGRTRGELRNAMIAIGLLVVVVAIPLRANSVNLWTAARREDAALAIAEEWLASTTWEVYAVEVDGNAIELVLGGDGDLPPAESAIAELREVMGEDMILTARIVGLRKEVIASEAS